MRQPIVAGFISGAKVTGEGVCQGDERGPFESAGVEQFAVLPDGVRFPEGITDPATGEIYVGTFDFGPNANKRAEHGSIWRACRDAASAAEPQAVRRSGIPVSSLSVPAL